MTHSVVARIFNPNGDRLTALVERAETAEAAEARVAALSASVTRNRRTWPEAVRLTVKTAPGLVDFSTVTLIEFVAVTK